MRLMVGFIDRGASGLGRLLVICVRRGGFGWLSLVRRRARWGSGIVGLVGAGFPQLFELPESPERHVALERLF
jgi:hypothetical protein